MTNPTTEEIREAIADANCHAVVIETERLAGDGSLDPLDGRIDALCAYVADRLKLHCPGITEERIQQVCDDLRAECEHSPINRSELRQTESE